jgi:hypothetical protein
MTNLVELISLRLGSLQSLGDNQSDTCNRNAVSGPTISFKFGVIAAGVNKHNVFKSSVASSSTEKIHSISLERSDMTEIRV